MNSKQRKMSFVLATVAFAMSTTWLMAAPVSHHFPNTATCNALPCNVDQNPVTGTFGLVLRLYDKSSKSSTRIQARSITPVFGWTGEQVAAEVANEVCKSAAFGLVGLDPLNGAWNCSDAECNDATAAGASAVTCMSKSGPDGFSITKAAASTDVVFDKTAGPLELNSELFWNATVGNAHGPDLYRIVLAQVVTNGVNGTVTFRAFHNQGGTNPRTFSVNTASFTTSEALHAAIKSGLEGMGLGLTVDNVPPQVAASLSGDGSRFALGNAVAVTNAAEKITRIDVDGVPGQSLIMETGDPELTPTMSQWAMILLIGLLLGTGVWMLRRFPLGG